MPHKSVIEYAISRWGGLRAAASSALAAPTFRLTYGGVDYDSLLEGSLVRRDASLGSGEAEIILDNSDGAWNTFHANRTSMGNEGIVKYILDGNTEKLFTGDVLEVEYDETRVIINFRDKLNIFLKQRIGSGQNPTTVSSEAGWGIGRLAWALLTNAPPNGAGLDNTEDPSNPHIDYTAHWDWRNTLNAEGYEVGAEITGQPVSWCLDRLAKMTNSYIWQGGDGRITFARPHKQGLIYHTGNTDEIGLRLHTDTIVNAIQVYYNYDTEDGEWEDDIILPAIGIIAESQVQYGRIAETDDNRVIWHNTQASAIEYLTELTRIYVSPIRMFKIRAFLPAFEEDIAKQIIIGRTLYGISSEIVTIEAIEYNFKPVQVTMQARWPWAL